MKRRNIKNLQIKNTPIKPEEGEKEGLLSPLALGLEFKLDLRLEDLKSLTDLGSGSSGDVCQVEHKPTGLVMAKKTIKIETKPQTRKQIIRELQIMHDCNHVNIIEFYGAFQQDGNIMICMQYMDLASLDKIYKTHGKINQFICSIITKAVLNGLIYLYDEHRIIHRDVKPSNILLNSHGDIKICDFGVSGILINSIANTFVGTSAYMSPERIKGSDYTIKSDVWSLGISIIEIMDAQFPFQNNNMSVFELLEFIVNEEPPKLKNEYDKDTKEFVNCCLTKDLEKRLAPKQLLELDFITNNNTENVDPNNNVIYMQWLSSITTK